MRIGILSDTHNRVGSMLSALAYLTGQKIDTIFHCGDVTTIETAQLMCGFTVHYVFGNGDVEGNKIRELLISANPKCTGDKVFTGEIGAVPIAATHGHLPGKAIALIASGQFAYVFHGHTHVQKDEMVGRTRVINPGALGSARYDGRTLCILNLETGQIEYPLFE